MDILRDDQVIEIAEKYGITVDPSDVTQYKLICVIASIEKKPQQTA